MPYQECSREVGSTSLRRHGCQQLRTVLESALERIGPDGVDGLCRYRSLTNRESIIGHVDGNEKRNKEKQTSRQPNNETKNQKKNGKRKNTTSNNTLQKLESDDLSIVEGQHKEGEHVNRKETKCEAEIEEDDEEDVQVKSWAVFMAYLPS